MKYVVILENDVLDLYHIPLEDYCYEGGKAE